VSEPRFQRRKEDRPAEIAEAALAAFAEKGYAATRVEEVAKRAGVSKGLLYLYFKTKEDLFKAVIRSFVEPRITNISASLDQSGLGAEEFIRGPFLDFIKSLPNSPIRIVFRLMIAEGHKHPDLTAYYWSKVVTPGLAMLRKLIARGVANGEFKKTTVDDFPQLLISPVLVSIFWKTLFEKQEALDSDRFIETHIDALLAYIRTEPGAGEAPC
jgi:AcrR family transcriptional regulator